MTIRGCRMVARGYSALAGAAACCRVAVRARTTFPPTCTVQAFVKPEGQRLQLLVRVPLAAMRDVDVPAARPGLSRSRARRRGAARRGRRSGSPTTSSCTRTTPRSRTRRVVDARVSLPSDRSFASYDEALAHLHGPRAAGRAPSSSGTRRCSTCCSSIRSQSDRSRVLDSIRASRAWARASRRRCASCRRTAPSARSSSTATRASCGSIRAGIRRRCASSSSGFFHILDGTDHLLFLLCLVIPFRRLRPLVADRHGVHRRALDHADRVRASASAPDALWFPPLIETLIARLDRLHGAREHRRRQRCSGAG